MSVGAVAVAVPARNEERLLPACLASVQDAVEALPRDVTVAVVVAADRCSDRTADLARAAGAHVVEVDHGGVGPARAAAVAAALALVGAAPERTWIACTDADTVVPRHWLIAQLALADGGGGPEGVGAEGIGAEGVGAERIGADGIGADGIDAAGVDVLLGTVQPPLEDLDPVRRARWLRTHPPGVAAGRVHGANLGIRASVYAAAGGFGDQPVHEDVDLVDRLTRAGAVLRSDAGFEVVTSARDDNRVPGGFAGFLRDGLTA